MIKAVIFDLDDTLYDYEKLNLLAIDALATYTCAKLNVSKEEFDEAFTWAKKETKKLLPNTASSHNRLLYCQRTLEYLKVPPVSIALDMYEIYWEYIIAHMELRAGTELLLEYCKELNLRVGICTDLTAQIQHRKLQKLQISSFIDAIVSSEEVGAEKPSQKIFQLIISKLVVSPEEVLYVGDSFLKDVIGASNAGMRVLWYSSEKSKTYQTVNSMKEIMEIIYEIQHN